MKTNTLNTTKHIALAAVVAFGLSTAAMGAYAAETNDVPTRTVRYSDLDMNSQKGVTVLYNRIRQAAEQVCGYDGVAPLAKAAPVKACIDGAVASGVQAVNNARLTSMYDSRNGVKVISVATLR
jgi:UrcA family protein